MFGAQCDGAFEGSQPVLQSLTRNRVNQVEIDATNRSRLDDLQAAGNVVGIVVSFEEFQLGWVETLCAHADAINAGRGKHVAIFRGDGRRVGFDREFDEFGEIEPAAKAEDQAIHFGQWKERGSSSAKKDGSGPKDLRRVSPEIGFAKHEIDESRHAVGGLAGDRIKIAVVAFVETEGDVNVKRGNLGSRQFGAYKC